MFTWNIVFLKKSDKTLIVELGQGQGHWICQSLEYWFTP